MNQVQQFFEYILDVTVQFLSNFNVTLTPFGKYVLDND